jgi:dipeptidyl aminopeptidase/acylaminoacyl peptidase
VLALLFLFSAVGARAEPAQPIPAETFFRAPEVRELVVSPGGRYAAKWTFQEGRHGVFLYDRVRDASIPVFGGVREVPAEIAWADDDTLLIVSRRGDRGIVETVAVDAVPSGDALLLRGRRNVRTPGLLVDPLPNEDDTILYSTRQDPSSVYRIQISKLAPYGYARSSAAETDGGQFVESRRVAKLDEPAAEWFADGRGEVRAALSVVWEPTPLARLWYRDSIEAPWRVVYSAAPEDFDLSPLAFAEDDVHLLVATDRDRDTFGLFEFDPGSGSLGRLLYEHPSAQVVGVVFDYSGRHLLAATTFEGGVRRHHYFRGIDERLQRAFENTFGDQDVMVTSASRDERFLALFVSSDRNPGAFYLLDARELKAQAMGRVAPWLEPEALAAVRPFRVRTADGLEVESFLTARAGADRPPLVVMPHGGPVGERNERSYDPESQYLAHAGFGVLQVNYRGSSGYGTGFEEAGLKQWGTGIEEDIEAAVAHATAQGWVDGQRACIVGSSYGGYSALMSVVRHSERYRCAATLAGVTDIGLMFNSSDFALSRWLVKRFARMVGDPAQEYERLVELSPVYRVPEIGVPVFVAHGVFDTRVDVEHAFRLRAMLQLHGKPFEWELIPEMGHGFGSPEQAARYFERLRDFLSRHLTEAGTGSPAESPVPPQPG